MSAPTGIRSRRVHGGARGVALIEAAIALPVLFLLFMGTMEAGFAYRDGNILARSTQQAARTDARIADGDLADYEALRALRSSLSSLTASSIERVIIYEATATGDEPPSSCKDLTPSDASAVGIDSGAVRCNVYSKAQVLGDQPARFEGACASRWDGNFCPPSRVRTGDTPQRVGVWVELSYDNVTSVLPSALTLTRSSVYELEPCVAGDTGC